jgi:hypothetical protein
MKRSMLIVLGVALFSTGCEMKGGDPVVTSTGKVPIPTVTKRDVTLTWTRATGEVQGYKIEGSLDNVNYIELGYINGQADGVILNLDTGLKYYFRVRSFNQGGNSAYSPVTSVAI